MKETLSAYLASLRGKSVAVLGAGVSNTPLIGLLLDAGVRVTIRDGSGADAFAPERLEEWQSKGAQLRLGADYLEAITEEVIFRTPGLMPHHPALAAAVARGAQLTSEMETFLHLCPAPVIAVTGSDGKTTTTTIISGLLKAAGYKVYVGGNIGIPLLDQVEKMTATDWVVLELSSFQLMTMSESPQRAVVTNLAPNHLDRHKDMAEYINAKKNIFLHQGPTDRVVLNWDNELTRVLASETPGQVTYFSRREALREGIWLQDGAIVRDGAPVLKTADIAIPGSHNVENFMAAIAAVKDLVPDEVIRDFAKSFQGVEHRIEWVRTVNGARYYNDSIASSPSRTIAGLRAFDQKVILIAGGYDKHIPFDVLGPEIIGHVKALYLTGDTVGKIRAAVEQAPGYDPAVLSIRETADLAQAVELAYEAAEPGDVVLMSPACASFDRYKNFMERGNAFKALVGQLEERK
ncbi:MAG: UDP-N-acetylmuramoyl-L-alanine--D-glutamate ligase [Muribaculaceae bacterium]|nr:UDP-N-acetylmuramoyl-L-alanine--D-glutamate ligase [Muribaculaceae bacterium]